ncbi:myosin-9-like [Chanodichthys erythropterus]|uniref:myosin-9-like n=1 Tax=Chanodichthys erythropterus TaxID=933992 RepID=UPI00351E9438
MLGVQREDKVWFEITDDQSDRTSADSQTSIVTVYGFYLQESPIHLTIIDTPGYGGTRGVDLDKEIAESLLNLCKSAEEIYEIHAVCLVIKATQNRLSDRQIYIFDAVQSLFGRDIVENIVLLFTHSSGAPPRNALTAVKEAKIKCALNDKKKPVYFLFNNCQSETADEDDEEDDKEREKRLDSSWNLSFKGMVQLEKFLDTIQPKSLKMTQDVLKQRKQLEANINNLQSRVQVMELKQNELKQTRVALEQNKKDVKENKNFEYEVDVVYKERVEIDPKMATCCTVCEENCHYPGCWWVSDLKWCSVMKDKHCTVCTNKCHYKEHIKGAKKYETKTKKEKRTYEDLKKKYDGKIRDGESLVMKLEEELQELEEEKIKLVFEAFDCVETLEKIALKNDSVFTLLHIDYLIEKLKDMNKKEKAEILEKIKKRAEEENTRALGFIKRIKEKKSYF